MKIIDLSQPIYSGMPVYKKHPEVSIEPTHFHENSNVPSVNKLSMGEHSGTHVDALSHMSPDRESDTIDQMPLEKFITEAICLDFSHKQLLEQITATDIDMALKSKGLSIKEHDTVLFYTDHYRKAFDTEDWPNGPALSLSGAEYLGNKKIAAFGVETRSAGVPGKSNIDVHKLCGKMGFTHYENLINLHKLVDKGRFQFIGLPLRITKGTASPVRAVALINE